MNCLLFKCIEICLLRSQVLLVVNRYLGEKHMKCLLHLSLSSFSSKALHSDEKPFKCDVKDCDKSYRRKANLFEHKIRIHNRLKSHKCFHNNCDQSFVTSTKLKQHIQCRHSNDTPLNCEINGCDK